MFPNGHQGAFKGNIILILLWPTITANLFICFPIGANKIKN